MTGRAIRAAVVMRAGMAHHHEWCGAMVAGLGRHGIQTEILSRPPVQPVDFAVCWGWRLGQAIRSQGVDTLVMEAGHVGDRSLRASCGWNGLGGRGLYVKAADGGERWEQNHGELLKPWRTGGRYALVLGQCPGDSALGTMVGNYTDWAQGVVAGLVRLGHAVIYRPHPLMANDRFHVELAEPWEGRTLEEDLDGAALAVSFNSTASVQSVLSGVPTVTLDPGAMAWPVSSHTLRGPPATPDRGSWCADMAWTQFTIDEIASGEAWTHLREVINHDPKP